MRCVSFIYRGRDFPNPQQINHASNMAIVDDSPLCVKSSWAYKSIDAVVDGETVFFGFGFTDSEFDVVKNDADVDAVRASLANVGGILGVLENYACYSGKLPAGRCECVGVETSWETMTGAPTVTLSLNFYGLVGAKTVEELEVVMKGISDHYYMTSDVNPVLVKVAANC